MKYHLTNADIALIAELRSQRVQWIYIAKIYNMKPDNIEGAFRYRMKKGMIRDKETKAKKVRFMQGDFRPQWLNGKSMLVRVCA